MQDVSQHVHRLEKELHLLPDHKLGACLHLTLDKTKSIALMLSTTHPHKSPVSSHLQHGSKYLRSLVSKLVNPCIANRALANSHSLLTFDLPNGPVVPLLTCWPLLHFLHTFICCTSMYPFPVLLLLRCHWFMGWY
jgi:hypothetical protein